MLLSAAAAHSEQRMGLRTVAEAEYLYLGYSSVLQQHLLLFGLTFVIADWVHPLTTDQYSRQPDRLGYVEELLIHFAQDELETIPYRR